MSKVCPNCLHPVRSGANYCGFCGSSLVTTPYNPVSANSSSSKGSAKAMADKPANAKRMQKGKKLGRSWIKLPIILLVLVLLAALALRYWPEILTLINQALPFIHLT